MMLCSRVAHDVAHITQICVAEGLSRARVGAGVDGSIVSAQLRRAGFSAITLTVTESNVQAVRLYESLGSVSGTASMPWCRTGTVE